MKWWMYLIIIGLLAGLVYGAIRTWDNHITSCKNEGRQELLGEQALADEAAQNETKKKQAEIRKQSRKVTHEIIDNNPDQPVGRMLQSYFERVWREQRDAQ